MSGFDKWRLYPHEALLQSQRDAAPDLYAALERVTELLVGTVTEMGCWTAEDHPKVIAARAALAKARGETA